MVVGSIYNPFNPISYMVLVGLVDFHFKRNYQASQKKWLSVQGLQQNVTHLVKNTVRFLKIPALCPAGSVWHVFLEQIKKLH